MKCEHGVDPFLCPVLGCLEQILNIHDPLAMWREANPSDRDLFIIECEEIVDYHFDILQRLDDMESALDDLKGA